MTLIKVPVHKITWYPQFRNDKEKAVAVLPTFSKLSVVLHLTPHNS